MDRYFKVRAGKDPWDWQARLWSPAGDGNFVGLDGTGQNNEYAAFNIARGLAQGAGVPDAAYQAASYGFGQIMGFHHKALGYPTARAMFEDAKTIDGQTRQFIGFFATDPRLVQAARQGNLREVFRIYNGPGQVDTYLAAATRRLDALGFDTSRIA